jgi:hypothetical protein
MNKLVSLLGFASLIITLTGCIVHIDGARRESSHTERVVVVPSKAEDRELIAEIDAISALNFQSSRADALRSIARRSDLTPAAQVHLVNTTLSKLDFENSRSAVLRALIQNPSFSRAGKEAILSQLEKLSFENSRTAILKAINERGPLNQ